MRSKKEIKERIKVHLSEMDAYERKFVPIFGYDRVHENLFYMREMVAELKWTLEKKGS